MENKLTKKPKLNLFALVSVASGFYVGYQEGKGVDLSETKEYLMKYGPTAFATSFSLVIGGGMKYLSKFSLHTLERNKLNPNLEVTLNRKKIRYKDLTAEEKRHISSGTKTMKQSLETLTETPPVYNSFIVGSTTAVQTTWGYLTGRFFSQIS